ncbi:hypothetical protein GCM10009678_12990 [Actinomadura kijaniata]|uniref:Uncharacterized protein n=1 Tax=Actinomadura namibiensis TaxID=182080 RepID=A0A7W3LNK5_ACTNM|nr:hypothetical protein [Actinomadura namibiensis]
MLSSVAGGGLAVFVGWLAVRAEKGPFERGLWFGRCFGLGEGEWMLTCRSTDDPTDLAFYR